MPMRLAAGERLGPYEIVELLGKGGMGEVYRARDSRLGRDVALKVLPDLFAADAERAVRFQREAQFLASLNHPNIGSIHGLEDLGGVRALVLELVEGETLADRLRRGPLAVEEALRIALQIADALEAAHDKGVIHRDLKPANTKITPDDKVKVLDFGLAKAMESGPAIGELSHSPTLSLATQAGVILGTAAYMSPEQAKGFQADRRSDVFSFGCVLYEMLTGRQAFQADTATETLAAVLMREPDLGALPSNLNPRLNELIRRCLEKNPKRRWQAIGDLRLELEAIAAAPLAAPAVTSRVEARRPLWRQSLPMALLAIAAAAIASAVTWWLAHEPGAPAVTRFSIDVPDDQQFIRTLAPTIAFSPDGTRVVYTANRQLFQRAMADAEARLIPGTGLDAVTPFFSPDGQWIGFFSLQDSTLKKIAISGGAPLTICKAGFLFGASWESEHIVFAEPGKGIQRVSASGGEPELLVATAASQTAYGPHLLANGTVLLYAVTSEPGQDRWDKAEIVAHSLTSGERKVLVRGGSDARYVPTGHLVYMLGTAMLAVPFDIKTLSLTGGPVPIVEGIMRVTNPGTQTGAGQFALSATGSLAFVPGSALATAAPKTLALADRTGKVQSIDLPPQPYIHPRVSPDGKRFAVATDDGKEAVVWVCDDVKGCGSLRRLTFGGRNQFPIWTRDGKYITFQSDREGDPGIYRQPADGSAGAVRLTKAEPGARHEPESWSPDGTTLSFNAVRGPNQGIWTVPIGGDRKPGPFVDESLFVEKHSSFSPDGKWVAYMSAPPVAGTRATEIFVQPFPPTGAKYQISTDSGRTPVWSPDMRQLIFHHSPSNRLMAVDIRTEPSLTIGKPAPFPIEGTVHPLAQRNYDMTPDGKQFLVVLPAAIVGADRSRRPTQQINVVLNWFEELKTRVPVKH